MASYVGVGGVFNMFNMLLLIFTSVFILSDIDDDIVDVLVIKY